MCTEIIKDYSILNAVSRISIIFFRNLEESKSAII